PRRTPFFFCCLLLCGCSQGRDVYAPPVQRQPQILPAPPGSIGYSIAMNDPSANQYIVRDIADHPEEGGWRWAFRRPELRFFLPSIEHLKFTMDFSFPERMFRETGPVTLAFFINGQPLDKVRYEKGGVQHYEKGVPAAMLRAGVENRVRIETDKMWTSKIDGATFGFPISRAGFSE